MSDVIGYVGPLCRYMTGEWDGARPAVEDLQGPLRPPGGDREHVIDQVLDWHGRVLMWLVEKYGRRAQSEWDEKPDRDYVATSLGTGGLPSLRALVHYAERPARSRPATVADVLEKRYRVDRADPKKSAFPQVLAPDLWLPVDRNIVFQTTVLNGPETCVGSSGALLRHLVRLNAGTLEGQPADLDRWAAEPPTAESSFDDGARFGLAVMMKLAQTSVLEQLPLLLCY